MPNNAKLVISIRLGQRPASRLLVSSLVANAGQAVDLTSSLELAAGKGWRRIKVPLACLGSPGIEGLALAAQGPMSFDLDAIGIVAGAEPGDCKGPF